MSGKPKYPKEVYDFIKENYGEYGISILPVVKDKFCVEISKNELSYFVKKNNLKSHRIREEYYTDEETKWLAENAPKFNTQSDITNVFNEMFPRRKRSIDSIVSRMSENGINLNHHSSKEEIEWLKENAPYYTSSVLAEMHNKIFKKQRTMYSLLNLAIRNGIKIFSDTDSRLDYYNENSTRVKEKGSIRFDNGLEYIKISKNSSKNKLKQNEIWIRRTKYEYEKHYGVKPKRWECVIQLDGDKTNYSKENLYLVPNYINGYIVSHLGKLIKDQPELNKAHILRFEVEKAIKDYEKENKEFKKWRKSMDEYDPANEGVNE